MNSVKTNHETNHETNENTEIVTTDHVSCVGNKHSSHPLVWYNLSETNHAICNYCNRKFIKDSKST